VARQGRGDPRRGIDAIAEPAARSGCREGVGRKRIARRPPGDTTMQTDRTPRSALLPLAAVAAILSTACGSASNPPPSAGATAPSTARPAPSAAPGGVVPGALLAVGVNGETDLRILGSAVGRPVMRMPAGTPDQAWGHILNVTPDGDRTRVQNLIFGEGGGRELVLDGRWALPTVGLDPVPGGRSL